jgi:hypothetical protein
MKTDSKKQTKNHEQRDLNVPAVACTALALAAIVVVIFISVHWLQNYFNAERTARTTSLTTVTAKLPPEPRLQSDPASDLERFRRQQDAILNSYGWIDEKAGIARIPIERAMDLIAGHGLPPPPASAIGKTPLQMQQEKGSWNKPSS